MSLGPDMPPGGGPWLPWKGGWVVVAIVVTMIVVAIVVTVLGKWPAGYSPF